MVSNASLMPITSVSPYDSMFRCLCCPSADLNFNLLSKKLKIQKNRKNDIEFKFEIPERRKTETVIFFKKTLNKRILHCILDFAGNQKLVFVDTRKINAHIQVHNKPIWKDLWIFAAFEFRARSSHRDTCTSLDQPRKLCS